MNTSDTTLFEPKGFLQQLSYVLKTVFLLFPSVLFIVVTWQALWVLTQGKDILIAALERDWVAGFFLIALLFYVLVTWYTGRILIYRKAEIIQILVKEVSIGKGSKELPFYLQVIFNMPRFFGYIILGIVWIALLKLVYWPTATAIHLNGTLPYLLLGLEIVFYLVQYKMTRKFRDRLFKANDPSTEVFRLKLFRTAGIVVLAVILANLFVRNVWLLILSIILIQMIFLFVVILRRNVKDIRELPRLNNENKRGNEGFEQWKQNCGLQSKRGGLLRVMYFANIPYKEKALLVTFICLGILALLIYGYAIGSLSWSVTIGSLTFVMLAFGVLVLVFAGVSIISVAKRVNFHFIFLVIAIIEGKFPFLEPHKVTLEKNANAEKIFADRPDIKTYFTNWLARRESAIDNSTEYPVVFVLADGGASRSGYWTASVLSSLDEKSSGKFADHLFCLSGASGGSVGNAAYYALLKKRLSNKAAIDSSLQTVRGYLSADFLTYTLARMLGPDVLRFLVPVFGTDRADALRVAMNEGGTGTLKGAMSDDIINYLQDTSLKYTLPVLCINTTHMQDARPAVISTIQINDSIYGRKMDVLSLLPPGMSLQLSTSAILGARFPYVSPAGRIAQNDSTFHYFVDGGYFDNSGAGFVHETILFLHRFISDTVALDTTTKNRYRKLKFYVIHAMNSPVSNGNNENVPPLQNDLMAPILTLMGSYESQTSVNNIRLKNYLKEINKDTTSYIDVGLYDSLNADNEAERIPMNWSISQHFVSKIDEQLDKQFTEGRLLPLFLNKIK